MSEARHLADYERASGAAPPGCEWLDAQTIDDLDLDLVFTRVNGTASHVGGQALWRWLTAPAIEREVIERRDRHVRTLGDAGLQERIRKAAPELADTEAELVPELLWGPVSVVGKSRLAMWMLLGLLALAVAVAWQPTLIVPLLLLLSASSLYDMFTQREVARVSHSLDVLGRTLDSAVKLARVVPPELRGSIDADLVVRSRLGRYLGWLRVNDPFGLAEFVRAAFQIRNFCVRRALEIVAAERETLRRIVVWVGEMDALRAVAARRVDVPVIGDAAVIEATELVHPALDEPVGNDITLRAGLLVTGSNASGKSTFLRTVAINAILAQSLCMTFGRWHAPLLRVRSAMRINDDLTRGMSTYAQEVESVGKLVHGVERRDLQTLFVLDEPFHGTNPAVRVPIVVAILEHLVSDHFVMAATHDLDVAHLVSPAFERGYFTDGENGAFDHVLKPGIAPSSNAVAMLQRAGYPDAVLDRIAALQARAAS